MAGLVFLSGALSAIAATFTHPGLLHSRDDLFRLSRAVTSREEPIFSGYERFRAHAGSQLGYSMRGPAAEIGRSPNVFFLEFDEDATATYQSALHWCVTGERAFADQAIAILNAWSARLERVTGADAALMATLGPFKLVNAAELLRHTDTGWPRADIARFERMLRDVLLPAIGDFALYANGNWDTACIKTLMAIGVFCDDPILFERAARYAVAGAGNGRITHYIVNETGQCQESGRDQQHTLLGLAHLAEAAEIAWQQGVDLFAHADHRLLHGFEYTARYLAGESVPFAPVLDRTGKYRHSIISAKGIRPYRAVFEHVWNHYEHRAGLAAPWSKKLVAAHRPEGAAYHADHPGFGTFLFARPPAATVPPTRPAPPAGVIARGNSTGITLTWIASIGAASYSIARYEAGNTTPVIVARATAGTTFTDRSVNAGALYRYVLRAVNAAGESTDAYPARACAGLPPGWASRDVGPVEIGGETMFDGETFTLEAAGTELGGHADQGHFVHTRLAGDGVIVARFVPQVSSQFSKFGLTFRDPATPEDRHATLLLTPHRSSRSSTERPAWRATLTTRAVASTESTLALAAPLVTWGRLLQPCWLRLERHGDTISAALSPDRKTWTTIGRATVAFGDEVQAGLVACSGIESLTTTVAFDSVAVTRR